MKTWYKIAALPINYCHEIWQEAYDLSWPDLELGRHYPAGLIGSEVRLILDLKFPGIEWREISNEEYNACSKRINTV